MKTQTEFLLEICSRLGISEAPQRSKDGWRLTADNYVVSIDLDGRLKACQTAFVKSLYVFPAPDYRPRESLDKWFGKLLPIDAIVEIIRDAAAKELPTLPSWGKRNKKEFRSIDAPWLELAGAF